MANRYLRYTFKLKSALALAATLGMIDAHMIHRKGVDYNDLYEKLHNAGYRWSSTEQEWRKWKTIEDGLSSPSGEDGVRRVGHVQFAPHVKVILEGPFELLEARMADLRTALELIGAEVVKFTVPRGHQRKDKLGCWVYEVNFPNWPLPE